MAKATNASKVPGFKIRLWNVDEKSDVCGTWHNAQSADLRVRGGIQSAAFAIRAAANVTCVRWSSRRWGLNPIENPTPFRPTRRTRPAIDMDACSEPQHIGGGMAAARAH